MRKGEVDKGSDHTVLVHRNLRRLPKSAHKEEGSRKAIVLFDEGLGYKSTVHKLESRSR